jgi:hypothetical protein
VGFSGGAPDRRIMLHLTARAVAASLTGHPASSASACLGRGTQPDGGGLLRGPGAMDLGQQVPQLAQLGGAER